MRVYAVVSLDTGSTVETFRDVEQAEAMIDEVWDDDPVLGGRARGRGDRARALRELTSF